MRTREHARPREGYTHVLVGIDSDSVPFRVFALTHPSRLVVDGVDESAD